MADFNEREVTLAIPFSAVSTVSVTDFVSIGSVHKVQVTRLTSDNAAITVWIDFRGIPLSNLVKVPTTLPTVLRGKYPVPPNSDQTFTIANFRQRDGKVESDITLTFYDQAGALLSHTGVLYLTIWASEAIDT